MLANFEGMLVHRKINIDVKWHAEKKIILPGIFILVQKFIDT